MLEYIFIITIGVVAYYICKLSYDLNKAKTRLGGLRDSMRINVNAMNTSEKNHSKAIEHINKRISGIKKSKKLAEKKVVSIDEPQFIAEDK